MKAQVGDRIVVESERAAQSGRTGVVEEILDEEQGRLMIRWDDGHTSILTPAAGAATIDPAQPASAS